MDALYWVDAKHFKLKYFTWQIYRISENNVLKIDQITTYTIKPYLSFWNN